jgi:hypothetical protein
MRCAVVLAISLSLTVFGAATPGDLHAQRVHAPFPAWAGAHPGEAGLHQAPSPRPLSPLLARSDSSGSGAVQGLLVGGLVGAVATTVFLIGFCGGDTSCGADEVGRAVVVIALPCAAAGALIGALADSSEE